MGTTLPNKNGPDTKEKIFLVAAQLFAKKGYNGVSMREISEKSGVTKPTIYYYFGSKEGIYEELVETGMQYVISSFERIVDNEASAKNKLVMMTKTFFQLAIDAPEYSKFFMTIVTPGSDNAILEKFYKKMSRQGNMIMAVIEQGVESGEFGVSAKPELATQIIGGVWQHFIWQQLSTHKKVLTDRLAEEVIEILFKGLNE